MKVVATNIFDFTTWYKFGYKAVSRASVIDLSDVTLTGETLLAKTGFFEEEYEVFYLEVKEDVFLANENLIQLSLYDVDFIIPVSEVGARLLQTKIPDFKLSEPLEQDLYQKLISARNDFLAMQGAKNFLASFDIVWKPEYEKLQHRFLQSLKKYKANLNAEQDTILDQLLFYERSKPYPLTDQGFLFDVGSIARTWFRLTDDDFKNKEELKETDLPKYELVEQTISLSKFLQDKETKGIWTSFINYYNENNLLHKLNEEFSLLENQSGLNNLLAIAFYLKFRDLIRNTRMLEDKPFTDEVDLYLAKMPEEAKLGLLLNGLFFGASKFRELHYKYVPLNIAKYKFKKPIEIKPPVPDVKIQDSKVEEPIIEKVPTTKEVEQLKEVEENISSETKSEGKEQKNTVFDKSLWKSLESVLKKYHKDQRARIKTIFDKIVKLDSEMFDQGNKDKLFIDALRKDVLNKKIKEESKISNEIVEEIQKKLKEILKKENLLSLGK